MKENKILTMLEEELCDKKDLIAQAKKEIYDMVHSRKVYKMAEVRELLTKIGKLKSKKVK